MFDYLNNNFVMIYELVGLLVLLFISAHINQKMKQLTVVIIILLAVSSISYYVELWTQSFDKVSIARPMLTSVVYSIYPFILLIIDKLIDNDYKQITIWGKLVWIPAIFSVPIYFTSQWTHIVFYFHETNSYSGGVLSWWPYIVFGFYVVVFLIKNFFYLKSFETKTKIIVGYIIIVPLLGVLLYILTNYSGNYTPILTSSLILYYLFLYIQNSRVDSLTGLLNRQCYYQDMNSVFERITAVASIDMNELKYYNDTFGHAKGDEALRTISNVLKKYCGKGGHVYRVGGDEFMILYYGAIESDVIKNIEKMRLEMSKTEYVCAFGYAMRVEGDIEETILISDKRMYIDKSELKKKILEKGGELHRRKDD